MKKTKINLSKAQYYKLGDRPIIEAVKKVTQFKPIASHADNKVGTRSQGDWLLGYNRGNS